MRRLLPAALALVLLLGAPPGALRADEPASPDDVNEALRDLQRRQADLVRTLLASGDDRSVAWGATWARELSLTAVEPELVALLREKVLDPDRVGYYGMLAVLDALIHLGTRLDAEALVPFVERHRGRGGDHEAAAVILAVGSEDPHARLAVFDVLDADDGSWEEAWVALGNVLRAAGTSGFAARLLGGLEVEVVLTVTDHERISGRGRSRTLFGGSGDGRLPPHEGYPPIFRHGLTFHPRPGDVLLADGARPVYRTRRPAARGFGTSRGSQYRVRSRFEWIAQILGTSPEDLPLDQSRYATVRWTDLPAFHADVEIQHRAVDDAFDDLVRLLDQHGAVTPAEVRGLKPSVRFYVLDVRDDKSVPLPEIGDAPTER